MPTIVTHSSLNLQSLACARIRLLNIKSAALYPSILLLAISIDLKPARVKKAPLHFPSSDGVLHGLLHKTGHTSKIKFGMWSVCI